VDGLGAAAEQLAALGDGRRGRHQRVAVLARALELDTEDGAVGLTNEAALLRLEADTTGILHAREVDAAGDRERGQRQRRPARHRPTAPPATIARQGARPLAQARAARAGAGGGARARTPSCRTHAL